MTEGPEPGEVSVWRAVGHGGGKTSGALHITDDCPYIKRADNPTRKRLGNFPAHYSKCSKCWPVVPEGFEEVLRPEEIQNMRHFKGWAIGSVTYVDEGNVGADRVEDCWIELLNGEGRAGEFGGVKAFNRREMEAPRTLDFPVEGYFEVYGFATPEAFEASSQTSGWYVDEWETPGQPDFGRAAP